MKSKLIIILLASALMVACNEDSGKESLIKIEDKPSAKAADDNKSSGVYKGTLVGSSGVFKLVIEAGEVVGYLELDKDEYILETDDITPADLGNAITNALFTNAAKTIELLFSVEANGENPTVTLTVVGHNNVHAVVFKEKSDVLLEIFEGYVYKTYPDLGVQVKGHLNIILSNDSAARVVFKSVEEFKLNNGKNGTKGQHSWGSDAYYGPSKEVPTIADRSIYRYVTNPANPQGPKLLEWIYIGLTYSPQQLTNKTFWKEGEYNYADSLRLKRKI